MTSNSIAFFSGASNVKISGGTFSVVNGNVANYDYSRHTTNNDSFNTRTTNIRDSYNDNSLKGNYNSALRAPPIDRSAVKDRTPSPHQKPPYDPYRNHPPTSYPPPQHYPATQPQQRYPPQPYPPHPYPPHPTHPYPNYPPYPPPHNYGQYPQPHFGSAPPANQVNNDDEDDQDSDDSDSPIVNIEPPQKQSPKSSSRMGSASTSAGATLPPRKPKKTTKSTTTTSSSGFLNRRSDITVSGAQMHPMSPEMSQNFGRIIEEETAASSDDDTDSENDKERMTDQMARMDLDDPTGPTLGPFLSRTKSNPQTEELGSPRPGMLPRPQSALDFPPGMAPHHQPSDPPPPQLGPYPPTGYAPWAAHQYPYAPPQGYYPPYPPPEHANVHAGTYTTSINSGNHHTSNVIDSYNDNSIVEKILRSSRKKKL